MVCDELRILSPCGILGYGFPDESFERGLAAKPHAIVVDAGSTDAGPHKLGAGVAIVSRLAYKKDLIRLIQASVHHHIPVVIGSAGGSGAASHVAWTLDIIDEIFQEEKFEPIKMAVIHADMEKSHVLHQLSCRKIEKMSSTVPALTKESLAETPRIVAQMGYEPILEALTNNAQLVICGRAYDPAPFAAVGILHGFDIALSYHMGKILECGALCCEPGTAKDCILGILKPDCFEIHPLNPHLRCTPTSIAAHTFYEKSHPFLLQGPGGYLNLENCRFDENGNGSVRVTGSQFIVTSPYQVKLEGARLVAYRTFVIAGVRDPLLIEKIDEVERSVVASVRHQFQEVDGASYQINFYNYGKNGVMGDLEPIQSVGHELGILFEVIAPSQELAAAICSAVRSTFLHYGYEGRKSTAGNLAFPFAPSDVDFGPVYEFSVYHLMEVDHPNALFPIDYRYIGGGR